MVAKKTKLSKLFKIKISQKINDKPEEKNICNSSQKVNLSNNKGPQDIDKKKTHNPTEK